MKTKKNVLALVTFLAGVIASLYCVVCISKTTAMQFFTVPFFMSTDIFMHLLSAILLIVSGFIGLATLNSALKKLCYALSTLSCITACIMNPSMAIGYFMFIIAVSAFIVQCLSNAPETKLFFIYGKGNIYIVYGTNRPSYQSVSESEAAKKHINQQQTKENNKKAVHTNVKKHRQKKYTGYAISPNGKNFTKKRKLKNSKR